MISVDLSLYKDESQLEKKKRRGAGARKRPYSKSSPRSSKNDSSLDGSVKLSPRKRSSLSSKKRKTKTLSKSKSLSKSKTPKKLPSKDKQTSNNSLPPISASTTNKVGMIQRIYRNVRIIHLLISFSLFILVQWSVRRFRFVRRVPFHQSVSFFVSLSTFGVHHLFVLSNQTNFKSK